jgi:hypothetical protein
MARFLAVLVLFSTVTYACDCPPSPICGAISPAAQFFVGTTIAQRKVPSQHSGHVGFVEYSVRVTESFTAKVPVGSITHVWSDPSSGCSWTFIPSTAYLFETHPDGSRLYTSLCTFTAELARAQPVLAQLRALKSKKRPPSLVGTLTQELHGKPSGGLAQTPVTARSSSGATYTATTDASGVFTFDTLPVGTYTLAPRSPSSLKLTTNPTDNPSRIPVPAGVGADASCRAYLTVARP